MGRVGWLGQHKRDQHPGVGLNGQVCRATGMGICGWVQGTQVGFGVQRLNSKSCLLGRGRVLALTTQITLGVRVQARCLNQSTWQVSEVKLEAWVSVAWDQVSMRVQRSGLGLLGALTGGP